MSHKFWLVIVRVVSSMKSLQYRCRVLRSVMRVRMLREISRKTLLRASMMQKDWRKTSLPDR